MAAELGLPAVQTLSAYLWIILFFCSISYRIWEKWDRSSFCSKWTGKVIVVKTRYRNKTLGFALQRVFYTAMCLPPQRQQNYFDIWALKNGKSPKWKSYLVMDSTMSKWTEISSREGGDKFICNRVWTQRILAIFGFTWESDMLWLPGKVLDIKISLRLKKKNTKKFPQNIGCQHAS